MITCWISLHETQADAGPLEFVRGSHAWPKSPPARSQFHAPDDWLAGPRAAAPDGAELETVPVVVEAGRRLVPPRPHVARLRAEHHRARSRGWRSSPTSSRSRPASTRRTSTSTYSRYRRRGDLSLDESFFPVVWDESGYRTPWLAELPDLD